MKQTSIAGTKSVVRDDGGGVWHFPEGCWVVCPKCSKPALVRSKGLGARISCRHCGMTDVVKNGPKPRDIGGSGHPWRGVSCLACGAKMSRLSWPGKAFRGKVRKTIRCYGCGKVRSYWLSPVPPQLTEGRDPFFGRPFFLSTMVGKHELWALNAEHLRRLSEYLGADLRKRTLLPITMTMMARLPRWMKQAGNRQAVLKGLHRLQRLADRLP